MTNATVAADTPFTTEALNDSPADDGMTIEGQVVEVKVDPAMAVLDPAKFAQVLFEPFVEKLARWKRSASRTKVDVSTPEGLAKAKEFEDVFTKIRTGADKKKTEFKKPLDLAGKKILEHFNALADAAKAEEKKWTDLIAAEKQRLAAIAEEKQRLERVRIEAIEGRIEHIRLIPSTLAKAGSVVIEAKLNEMVAQALAPADFDEHLPAAVDAQNTAINELRQLLTDVRDRENRDAELARLRAADEQRRKDAVEAQRKMDEAAAAMKVQQDQMAAMLEVQGLANALTAAGQAQDRGAVEAALAKARAFDPAAYGQMAPMATMARAAVLPLLEQLLEDLPAPVVVGVDPAEPGADTTVVVPIEADDTGVVIGAAVVSTAAAGELVSQARAFASKAGGRLIPKVQKPHDLDLADLVAKQYDVTNATAIDWLAAFDADAARAALAGA